MSDFAGFPHETVRFLGRLAENNNREWFEAHRSRLRRPLVGAG